MGVTRLGDDGSLGRAVGYMTYRRRKQTSLTGAICRVIMRPEAKDLQSLSRGDNEYPSAAAALCSLRGGIFPRRKVQSV